MHELILGGQRSGKSGCAETRAADWLAASPGHEALLIATALGGDAEMRQRIDRHRADRAARVPRLACIEEPRQLARAVAGWSAAQRLVVVDCLTLWLTNLLMPHTGPAADAAPACRALVDALRSATGPVVLVSNEIGLGLVPLGADARRFVDELGRLHQALAACCGQVTLMVAGIEMRVKGAGR